MQRIDVRRQIMIVLSNIRDYKTFRLELQPLLNVIDFNDTVIFSEGDQGPRGSTNCPCLFREIEYDHNFTILPPFKIDQKVIETANEDYKYIIKIIDSIQEEDKGWSDRAGDLLLKLFHIARSVHDYLPVIRGPSGEPGFLSYPCSNKCPGQIYGYFYPDHSSYLEAYMAWVGKSIPSMSRLLPEIIGSQGVRGADCTCEHIDIKEPECD